MVVVSGQTFEFGQVFYPVQFIQHVCRNVEFFKFFAPRKVCEVVYFVVVEVKNFQVRKRVENSSLSYRVRAADKRLQVCQILQTGNVFVIQRKPRNIKIFKRSEPRYVFY